MVLRPGMATATLPCTKHQVVARMSTKLPDSFSGKRYCRAQTPDLLLATSSSALGPEERRLLPVRALHVVAIDKVLLELSELWRVDPGKDRQAAKTVWLWRLPLSFTPVTTVGLLC